MSPAAAAAHNASPEPRYTLAVRALCEFTAKQGDLDFRFTPSPTAQEGSAGHAWVTSSRPPHYQREVVLRGDYRLLRVRGRADGYDPRANQLEEIKTYRGDLQAMPANHRALHWAQVKVYGAMLCRDRNLAHVDLALVYFDLGSQRETLLVERHSAVDLQAYFETQCERFLDWAQRELTHRAQRDAALADLQFPHAGFHAGQHQLSRAVYHAVRTEVALLAQAPTGIGKTIATLFAMLKACPRHTLDKIYFLTAKTSGRAPALLALQSLYGSHENLPLRVLEFVSKENACEHPGSACSGSACPLARGFYDRLPAARQAALGRALLEQSEVRDVALAHQVCPYYLAQELTRWSDVIIGDYNHYFDASALLYSLRIVNEWRVGVLVDEAHNLLERGRQMYTARLTPGLFRAAQRAAPPTLRGPLSRLQQAWASLSATQVEPYVALEAVPDSLTVALQAALSAMTEQFAQTSAQPDADLQRLYFDALYFSRLCDSLGSHSVFDLTLTQDSRDTALTCELTVRNIIPAPFLKPRLAAAHACVLFSATLTPQHFYRDTLGLPQPSHWIDVDSPFEARQLSVRIERRISTRFRDRPASLAPIADLIARQYAAQPGNYLAFFSSFDYLRATLCELSRGHSTVPIWEQSPRMPPQERREFLERFTPHSRGIGFAVLGGAFAEASICPTNG